MQSLYCVSILNISQKPTFIGKYLVHANYTSDTILDILEGEDLNIETGASHAFQYDGLKYLMHFVTTTELICVVSSLEYKSRLLAQMLSEIKMQYDASKKSNKNPYTFLKQLGDKYNDTSSIDIISRTQEKLNEVKSVMHQNIEIALENCTKLETLEIQAQNLAMESGIFKNRSRALKNKMWWKNIKMKIYLGLIILLILGIITGVLCAVYPPNKN